MGLVQMEGPSGPFFLREGTLNEKEKPSENSLLCCSKKKDNIGSYFALGRKSWVVEGRGQRNQLSRNSVEGDLVCVTLKVFSTLCTGRVTELTKTFEGDQF